jgi:hypothetical protein
VAELVDALDSKSSSEKSAGSIPAARTISRMGILPFGGLPCRRLRGKSGRHTHEVPAMAQRFPSLEPKHIEFIAGQHVFFTASATATGHINLSPRSTDMLRVLGPSRLVYLDRTGSGNETAAHLLADGRLTIMLCAFAGPPLIMRLYGAGRAIHRSTPAYRDLLEAHFADSEPLGARQMIELGVDLVQTSCGYGVPFHDYVGERPTMDRWAEAKGPDGLDAYQHDKNQTSLDGLPTGLFAESEAAE